MLFPNYVFKVIHPYKPIFSIVTCPEELGTGSNTAIKEGIFGQNQFEEKVDKGESIHSNVNIEQKPFQLVMIRETY